MVNDARRPGRKPVVWRNRAWPFLRHCVTNYISIYPLQGTYSEGRNKNSCLLWSEHHHNHFESTFSSLINLKGLNATWLCIPQLRLENHNWQMWMSIRNWKLGNHQNCLWWNFNPPSSHFCIFFPAYRRNTHLLFSALYNDIAINKTLMT